MDKVTRVEQERLPIFTSRGMTLLHIAAHPGCTIKEIADVLCLTRRSVWSIVGELRRVGMIKISKRGRNHYYTVNLEASLFHPSMENCLLWDILGNIKHHYHSVK